MVKQIDIASFECDCGHQMHFFEKVIWEMQQISHRRREGIGEGDDPHSAIFHKGEFVAIFCPKAGHDIPVNRSSSYASTHGTLPWTHRQGQVLAFIASYTKLNRRPPAQADIARYFQITPPTAHGLVEALARKGLIERKRGVARSITLRVDAADLSTLK